MFVGRDFDVIEPSETDVFTLEFTSDLVNGVAVTSSSWTCALVSTDAGSTADPAPGSRLQGAANVTTETDPAVGLRTFSSQKVGTMVDGNVYLLEATATTSDGRTLQLYSHVRCAKAA